MSQFAVGQRWISATESELGLGLVEHFTANRVTVVFLASNERRTYAIANAPLTRVMFENGDEIEDENGQKIRVEQIQEKQGRLIYTGKNQDNEDVTVDELYLNHHTQFNQPQDRFFTGQFDPTSWFELRYQTWLNIKKLKQSAVHGMVGARTALLPHQIYITLEVAQRNLPRVMLADEVGLGKTIEAGLILHHRLLNGLSRRVLIIVPEPLLHQWLVEMLRRFNLHFSIFNEQRCLDSDDGNPFDSEQLILCSMPFIAQNAERAQQIVAVDWDFVVIDEAHHLQWDEQQPSAEYALVEKLAIATPGLLLLTATPEQLGKKDHFARLRLLDPDRFYNYQAFLAEEKEFEPVAELAENIINGNPLDKSHLSALSAMLKDEKAITLLQHVAQRQLDDEERGELLDILLDHHGTGRVLFRNSRHTIKGFPARRRFAYPLVAQEYPCALQDDPRIDWLSAHLTTLSGAKALLICHHKNTALQIAELLKTRSTSRCVIFHEDMSIVERDRAAAYFADPEGNIQLLVCSEIGSEGRNFQFAHHLILFDLPENPDLLQQRIGRLDRIGQKQTIDIHIPYIERSKQHILFRWYDEGFNAFVENHTAAQRVYETQKQELATQLQAYREESLQVFLQDTQQKAASLQAELHKGRDLLLELNSCDQSKAQQFIRDIRHLQEQLPVWPYMERLFDCYGVESEYHSPDCYIISPGNHMRLTHFPELQEAGVTITVNRETALHREDLQFLSWEHPMTAAAMDLILSSETGNAAISTVQHQQLQSGQFLIEVLFIAECSAPDYQQINRFLPPTPIRILLDQSGQELSALHAHESFVDIPQKVDKIQLNQFIASQRTHILELLRNAKKQAEGQLQKLVQESCQSLVSTQGKEIKRLVRLKKINPNITEQEIALLKNITEGAFENIRDTRLRMDAVRLIVIV